MFESTFQNSANLPNLPVLFAEPLPTKHSSTSLCGSLLYGLLIGGVLLGSLSLVSPLHAEDSPHKSTPTIVAPKNNSELSGPNVALDGSAAPNTSLEIYVDGIADGTTKSNESGEWHYTVGEKTDTTADNSIAPLQDGIHKIRAVVRGDGGKFHGSSDPITITIKASTASSQK